MILAAECAAACLLFTIIMVGGVLWKKEAFMHEYAPEVQKRFLEMNPGFVSKEKSGNMLLLVIEKIAACILFTVILTVMIRLAGAETFLKGTIYTYIIWFVVNWYDVFALDMGVFAHWKKVRLPGTEDMDKEYTSNYRKHIKDGFFGTVLGVPISCICGWLAALTA